MSPKTALALIGNPGAGKSTILNGVAGSAVFKSGLSIGTGLTTEITYHETDRYILCDTPGLDDISRRDEAVRQLDALLSRSVPLKIAFVVTLCQGRVRAADKKTIDMVLSAFSGLPTNDSFGVIVNQTTASVTNLLSDSANLSSVKETLLDQRWTSHWCVVAMDESLRDCNGGLLMTPELGYFLDALPVTKQQHKTVHLLNHVHVGKPLSPLPPLPPPKSLQVSSVRGFSDMTCEIPGLTATTLTGVGDASKRLVALKQIINQCQKKRESYWGRQMANGSWSVGLGLLSGGLSVPFSALAGLHQRDRLKQLVGVIYQAIFQINMVRSVFRNEERWDEVEDLIAITGAVFTHKIERSDLQGPL